MLMGRVFAACASTLLLLVSPAMAANTTESGGVILVRGNKMYNSMTGQRFIIKGMTYEYVVDDEHYEKYSKAVIAEHLADVELNTLRLYDINPDLSYDKFMKDMAAQGVYVIVGGTPDNTAYFTKYREGTLKKANGPEDEVSCYSPILLEYGKKILKNFAKYDNTLAILIGNEVMQKDLTPAACVKQYAADLKTWMRVNSKMMRLIPIAYAAADSAYAGKINSGDEYHTLKLQGLLCGDKVVDGVTMRSIDLYLINEYRWCPGRTFAVYQTMQTMAQGLPIPIGFGEYGCKLDAPRDWAMVPYFYDEPSKTEGFSDIFSGGLAYSFGEAKLPPGSLFPMFSGGSMDPLGQPSNVPSEDFTNLKEMFANHPVYNDVAKWDKDAKCKWTPEIAASVSPSNKRASTSGWIIPDCSADVLKVIPSDTWVMKSRQGMDCAAGDECDVPVKEALGTTQEDLCGKSTEPVTNAPGGSCKSSDECLNVGECVEVDKVKQCKCAKCYTGTNCGFKDESTCPSDSSAPSVTPEPSSAANSITSMAAAVTVVASVALSLAL